MRRLDLLRKYDKPVPRYTSYPTAAAFHAGVGAAELAAQLAIPSEDPLSLYVHVPFCRHACWYCGCHRLTTQLGSKRIHRHRTGSLRLGRRQPGPGRQGGEAASQFLGLHHGRGV